MTQGHSCMTTRKAVIVGATGLIGSFCLPALLDDQRYSEVTALTRRPLHLKHPKLQEIITNFDENLDKTVSSISAHDIFCCLGTTIRTAGSQEEFRKIDYALVVRIAELMKKHGAEQFLVISAMGADKDSRVFYNRIKGEMEEAVKELKFPCVRIIRPSLLLGPRLEFRLGERIATALTPVLRPFLHGRLAKYKPVEAEKVARFMVAVAGRQPLSGIMVYESDLISQHTMINK